MSAAPSQPSWPGQRGQAEPKLTPVESSNLRGVGHDEASKSLTVAFNNRSVYQYEGVPTAVYQGLVSAKSVGQFFNSQIKGKYKGVMIVPPPPKKQPSPDQTNPT
jgi:KTSC domain-containing protein